MFLVGQTAAPSNSAMIWATLVAATATSLVISITFLILLFRHLRSVRQLTHLERLRSLEAGFPVEAPEETKAHAKFMHNAFWISFWLVVSVPGASFSACSAASAKLNGASVLQIVIWSGAAMTSIAAVACATALMIKTRPHGTLNSDTFLSKKR